jgi:predicted RND superfamily exporter protein
MLRAFLSFPLRAPRLTLLVLAAITLVLGVFAARIRIDAAIENLLPADNPDRRYYEAVKAVFGSEEASVVGVFGDVFSLETLATINQLSRQIAAMRGARGDHRDRQRRRQRRDGGASGRC